jgi:hypothetical protein
MTGLVYSGWKAAGPIVGTKPVRTAIAYAVSGPGGMPTTRSSCTAGGSNVAAGSNVDGGSNVDPGPLEAGSAAPSSGPGPPPAGGGPAVLLSLPGNTDPGWLARGPPPGG